MSEVKKIKYQIVGKKVEAPNVVTLELSCLFNPPAYAPGQFIDVYFPELNTPQGKSYSLSSAPSENKFFITVKAIGEFSNRLFNMREGDYLVSSPPYGFFYSDQEDTHLVMLAGGIGVAPFKSMIMEQIVKNPDRKISLFYSSRTEEDIIFREELDLWQKHNRNFKIKHFLTRQPARNAFSIADAGGEQVSSGKEKGRITAGIVLKEIPQIKNCEFLICGSIAFVRDMRRGLRDAGVLEEKIYTEAFFSH